MVECLPSMGKALGLTPHTEKKKNLSAWKAEAEGQQG
jgi:hypothetical protein